MFLAAAVYALGWAHCSWKGSCQWLCVGPIMFPAAAAGALGWAHAVAMAAADDFVLAQLFLRQPLPMP
jgi:hypothetical protein